MADVFEEREDLVAPRMRLLNLIEATPNLDWLLLTKRPENINKLTARWDGIMPNNVWVGTTGGTQKTLDKNLSELMRVNARIRFVSVEPLIAPVRLDPFDIGKRDTGGRLVDWVIVGGESGSAARPCALEWLEAIVEECHSAQIPCLVKQLGSLVVSEHRTASAATLRTIFGREPKSAIAPNGEHWAWRMGTTHPKGGDPSEWPEELRVRQFPEAASP
jgi:protein gp37